MAGQWEGVAACSAVDRAQAAERAVDSGDTDRVGDIGPEDIAREGTAQAGTAQAGIDRGDIQPGFPYIGAKGRRPVVSCAERLPDTRSREPMSSTRQTTEPTCLDHSATDLRGVVIFAVAPPVPIFPVRKSAKSPVRGRAAFPRRCLVELLRYRRETR